MNTANVQTVIHWYHPQNKSRPVQMYDSRYKLQHHTHPNCNNATTTTLDVGHPAVKRRFCQRCILPLKPPQARITGQ
jgi:hypothetical protein